MSDLIKVENNEVIVAQELIDEITKTEMMAKEVKDRQDEMKSAILKAMEENGIKQIKNDMFTISYTEAHTSERFDSTAFKKDMPNLYEKFLKESNVKSSIRITLNYKNMMKGMNND